MNPPVYGRIEKLLADLDKTPPADTEATGVDTMHKNNEGNLGKNNALAIR